MFTVKYNGERRSLRARRYGGDGGVWGTGHELLDLWAFPWLGRLGAWWSEAAAFSGWSGGVVEAGDGTLSGSEPPSVLVSGGEGGRGVVTGRGQG